MSTARTCWPTTVPPGGGDGPGVRLVGDGLGAEAPGPEPEDAVPDPLGDGAGLPTRTPSDLTRAVPSRMPRRAPVIHTGLLHEGSTKDDQPRKPPLGFFLAVVHTAKPGSALRHRRGPAGVSCNPRHTPHTLQVWLRTSAKRHETEHQKRARFLAQYLPRRGTSE